MVFIPDSESVSTEHSSTELKTCPSLPLCQRTVTHPCSWSLSLSLIDTLFPNWTPPTTGSITVWQHCLYSPHKAGKKPSSSSVRWTNVIINLYRVEELSALYVKTVCSDVGIMHKPSVPTACRTPSNYSPMCGTFISTCNCVVARLKICLTDDGWKKQQIWFGRFHRIVH